MRHAFAAGLVSMDDDVAIQVHNHNHWFGMHAHVKPVRVTMLPPHVVCVCQTPIPYVMWDERMTTLDARGSLWENKRMSKCALAREIILTEDA